MDFHKLPVQVIVLRIRIVVKNPHDDTYGAFLPTKEKVISSQNTESYRANETYSNYPGACSQVSENN
jgi:hypothetical protein